MFCAKLCDPTYAGGAIMCNHVYDEVRLRPPTHLSALNHLKWRDRLDASITTQPTMEASTERLPLARVTINSLLEFTFRMA
jgi:hypothetical protein